MKEIPNCPNYYASVEGDIYCDLPRGKQKKGNLRKLSPGLQSKGKYYFISIKDNNGIRKPARVHRLVCMAYHGLPPFEKATVSHLDGNWRNNKPDNLKWESYADNLARRHDHGTDDTGVHNSRSKINLQQLIEIRRLLKENELSHREIGLKFNVNRVFITKIANGNRYKGQGV